MRDRAIGNSVIYTNHRRIYVYLSLIGWLLIQKVYKNWQHCINSDPIYMIRNLKYLSINNLLLKIN